MIYLCCENGLFYQMCNLNIFNPLMFYVHRAYNNKLSYVLVRDFNNKLSYVLVLVTLYLPSCMYLLFAN